MGTMLAINGNVINSQEPLPIPVDILTLLWENPNPGATFAAQDITLASDDYDFLLLLVQFSPTYDRMMSFIVEKGNSGFINAGSTGPGGAIGMWREFARTNNTTYSVSGAHTATGVTAESITNSNLIPNKIYGFKKQVPMQDGGVSRGSVSVTADGVKTYGQLLNSLFALVDKTRITNDSYLILKTSSSIAKFGLTTIIGSSNSITHLIFDRTTHSSNEIATNEAVIHAINSEYDVVISTTYTNHTSLVPTSGIMFTIVY